jgi:hypothetical protein
MGSTCGGRCGKIALPDFFTIKVRAKNQSIGPDRRVRRMKKPRIVSDPRLFW